MSGLSLYHSCLRKVSLLLRDGIWKSGEENPFCFLPTDIVQDLVSTTLRLRHPNGFRAADLELLLTSGTLREFRLHSLIVRQELIPALKSLVSACQNLEALTLTELVLWNNSEDASEALQDLLRKSSNLRIIHSSVQFDLKALRNCRKLQKIMLHFHPNQPWTDFLGEEHGGFKTLDALELFTICLSYYTESHSVTTDYMVALLKHCPALTSFGFLDTSRVLAQLHRTRILPQVKLRQCSWRNTKYPDFLETLNYGSPEWIQDAVAYHPFVEKLRFIVYSIESVAYLSGLRNLVHLDIQTKITGDFSVQFCKVLGDIGHQLKYLSLEIECPIDISVLLQSCPYLIALRIGNTKLKEFAKPFVSLPRLEHLTLSCNRNKDEQRIFPLLSDCNNLRELFMIKSYSFDDKTLDKFLRRNSLSNLKIAFFELCGLHLTKNGFKKLFRNAPDLEKIEVYVYLFGFSSKLELEKCIKRALLQTNHNALFNKRLVSMDNEFFEKKRRCYVR